MKNLLAAASVAGEPVNDGNATILQRTLVCSSPDPVRADMGIQSRRLDGPIVRMGTVDSTMIVARELERYGVPEGITIIAAAQTHGRGRAGRRWESADSSGLYFSTLLRPNIPIRQFELFAMAVGLAICEALDPEFRFGLRVKWPNDIQFEERKLAGILVTTSLSGMAVESAILGVGLNLYPDPARPDHAIALAELPDFTLGAIDDVYQRIIDSVSLRYTMLLGNAPTTAIHDWESRLASMNDYVIVEDGDLRYTGFIRGLSNDGGLLLETPTGLIVIRSGELTRGPVRVQNQ